MLPQKNMCSIMIYREALHHDSDEPNNGKPREINSIMNESDTRWKAIKSTHRFSGKIMVSSGAGKREADVNGFMKLSEDTELPFE